MNRKHHVSNVSRPKARPGEGVSLQVQTRSTPLPSGLTSHDLKFDIATLPAPDRKFGTDVVGLLQTDESVKLLFGQKNFLDNDVKNLVVVSMTPSAITNFVASGLDVRRGAINSLEIEKHNRSSGGLLKLSREPQSSIVLPANIAALAVAGEEACLDFYMASAFSLSAASNGAELAVDPVVRVTLTTKQLLMLLDEVERVAESLRD